MLVAVSDTHARSGHKLTGRTLEAVREAEMVVHAGDFNREPALDAFCDVATDLHGVYGNTDSPAVRERLPVARNLEYEGLRFAVTHTREGGPTALSLFGRERGADVVVFGHSHRPTLDVSGPVALLNPGSHAQPRGNRPGHAELEPVAGGLRCRLVTPDGEVFAEETLVASG
ncbi:YfcE family phosphodiesterase [Salinigranum rubrum]|uniref:Phosphoesterase n=1 Tax=Salinigranum rubrum TaxID=755307 RepID=A0A2I8VNB8_9EURY|nr:metallophosphoesterase [Salinigranum rubrum]AUV83432.1 YfcE family phosphodiesterase [Salinigranum rubrum]